MGEESPDHMKNFDMYLFIMSILINGGGMALNGAKLGDKFIIPGAIVGVLFGVYFALQIFRNQEKDHNHDRNNS